MTDASERTGLLTAAIESSLVGLPESAHHVFLVYS